MLTVQIRNQTIEEEFHHLVDVLGSEERVWDEVFKFMQVYFLVFTQRTLPAQDAEFQTLLAELRASVRQRGAFADLTHEELLTALHQTRDEIWETDYQPYYERFLGH